MSDRPRSRQADEERKPGSDRRRGKPSSPPAKKQKYGQPSPRDEQSRRPRPGTKRERDEEWDENWNDEWDGGDDGDDDGDTDLDDLDDLDGDYDDVDDYDDIDDDYGNDGDDDRNW